VLKDALGRAEEVVDRCGVAQVIEAVLPKMGRHRQLSARTLLVGILLAISDDRPCHLTRVHQALCALGFEDRRRLDVDVCSGRETHLLTYRQVEHTFRLIRGALSKLEPDGRPSQLLQDAVDRLTEASIPDAYKDASRSLALDWSDHETFARPPLSDGGACADKEASWGHRNGGVRKTELFFGYYFSDATMVKDESGGPIPELIRRMTLTSCHVDPPATIVSVLEGMVSSGTPLGDVLVDSGFAHRRPESFALPLRNIGAQLVMDLHPHDRGPQGTYKGAICHNGSLYCPGTPVTLLQVGPLNRGASRIEAAENDSQTEELEHYKLGRITAADADGFYRVSCPASQGKVRCPAKPSTMLLSYDRPEVVSVPEHLQACCTQKTITVEPAVNAKTAQKHSYPSEAHRQSYARRTAVERGYSTLKDPASTDTGRGWTRLMGLAPLSLLLACAVVVRNMRVVDSFEERMKNDEERTAAGLPPKRRRRRRRSIDDLLDSRSA
jgi:hypothetical protein